MSSPTKKRDSQENTNVAEGSGGDILEPAVTPEDLATANTGGENSGGGNINISGDNINIGGSGNTMVGANNTIGGGSGNTVVGANNTIGGGGNTLQLQGEVAKLKVLLEAAQDNVLRARADAENARNRALKDKADGIMFANKGILLDLLPVLDSLEMALAHLQPSGGNDGGGDAGDSALDALADGVSITLKQFLAALSKHGVEPMATPLGTPFDPNFHEGLMLENNPDLDNNTVSGTLQTGYTLNGRVVRPAKVKVSKK